MKSSIKKLLILIFCLFFLCLCTLSAWHDATHIAIARAAGLNDLAYLAIGADMAKVKAGALEGPNHYCNLPDGKTMDASKVLAQVQDYNKVDDVDGHLYGAIIGALNEFILSGGDPKYIRYPLGYALHYLGDLSMPLHNVVYNDYNKKHHALNDAAVEGPDDESFDDKVARITKGIRKKMKKMSPILLPGDIKLFYTALAQKIADIANNAASLGYKMQQKSPPQTCMTEDEAYYQLAQSALLIQAIYKTIGRD